MIKMHYKEFYHLEELVNTAIYEIEGPDSKSILFELRDELYKIRCRLDERHTIPWSRDIPKKPGLYWYRRFGQNSYEIIRLEINDIEEIRHRSDKDWWAGPIPEPIDAK